MAYIVRHWKDLPGWRVYLEACAAFFVTMILLQVGLGSMASDRSIAANSVMDMLDQDPVVGIARIVLIPALETLVWQAVFVEGCVWLRAPPWAAILASPILFAVGLHWQRGALPMLEAFCFWLLLGLVYMSQRPRSFVRACTLTTVVHWTPVAFLLVAPHLIK